MIEIQKRKKCDICGKLGEWEEQGERVCGEANDDTIFWRHLHITSSVGYNEIIINKDYCSTECIIEDIKNKF